MNILGILGGLSIGLIILGAFVVIGCSIKALLSDAGGERASVRAVVIAAVGGVLFLAGMAILGGLL